jgi:hypothetical protein
MGGGTRLCGRLVTGLVPVNGSAHTIKQKDANAGKAELCDMNIGKGRRKGIILLCIGNEKAGRYSIIVYW